MNIITELGYIVKQDMVHEGYYTISLWIRTETNMVQKTEHIDRLTWTEAVDVLLVCFDLNRPGGQPDGSGQSALW